MKKKFGFEATHLPYRSSPQSISDVVAGHVNSSFAEMGASVSLIQDGKLKALAITSLERSKALPQVPTMAEATQSPGYEAVSWHAIFAPIATPAPIVERLHFEIKRITSSPIFKDKVAAIGLLRSIQQILKGSVPISALNGKNGALWCVTSALRDHNKRALDQPFENQKPHHGIRGQWLAQALIQQTGMISIAG